MKDRDRLIEAAFDGEVLGLRTDLDPQSKRELDLLVGLKTDLRALKEVPECQLSTEHLRNAVLNRPVRQRKSRNLGWVLGPVAAVACASLFLAWNKPSEGRQVAVRDMTERSAPSVSDVLSNETAVPPVHDEATNVTTIPDRPVVSLKAHAPRSGASKPSGSINRAHASVNRKATDLSMATDQGGAKLEFASMKDKAVPSGELAMTGAVTSVPAPEDAVVVITDKGDENGMAEAHEVSQPKDVVFGG